MVQINARKFDNKIHRSWKCKIIERKDSLLIFVGEFGEEIIHKDLGIIKRGTISYEYYWTDRWYNIFRFHEPDGVLRNFYCNVNTPPIFEGGILDYIDLDIDVLVWKDYSFEILDVEEFEYNSLKYNYSEDVIENAKKSLDELVQMINKRHFPFDFSDEKL
jgi:protein associated with RNAse G/E